MNYHFAIFCQYIIIIIITNYGCYGQRFIPLYDLKSVQKVDSLTDTSNSLISDGARIYWSSNLSKYKIGATGYDDLETFEKNRMAEVLMVSNVVKIVVYATRNFWLCRFSTAISARGFYYRNHQNESTQDVPYFNIDVVNVRSPHEDENQTFYEATLYMKTYGRPANNHRKFILKSRPQTGQNQSTYMIFLSGRFSIEKIGDQLSIYFVDAENWSCFMDVYNDEEKDAEMVFNGISSYARYINEENSGWMSNLRYDVYEALFLQEDNSVN